MENEIKVGDWIRTNRGTIDKITSISHKRVVRGNASYLKEDIVKHSSKIKDILEKGDLIYTDCGLVWYDYKKVDTIVVYNGRAYIEVDEREINKIYTKEMMESISYKVTKM